MNANRVMRHVISILLPILFTVFPLNTFAQEISSIRTLTGHTGSVRTVAFSPDGQILASGGAGRIIHLWNPNTGEPKDTLKEGSAGWINSVAFSPDGQILAGAGGYRAETDQDHVYFVKGYFDLYNATTGESILSSIGHSAEISSIAFSPDGQILAGALGNTIVLLTLDTELWTQNPKELSVRTLHTDRGSVNSVTFSPDGKVLASGSSDGRIHLWNPNTEERIRTFYSAAHINSVTFSPDGKVLASGGDSWKSGFSWSGGYIPSSSLHDATTGEKIDTFYIYAAGAGFSVAFSPDGKVLASGSGSDVYGSSYGAIHLLDVGSWRINVTALIGHTEEVYSVAFSPDGKLLASGSRDKTIQIWEIPSTRANITALPVDAPSIGDKLIINIDITEGKDITGYQAKVIFDSTALRYVEGANGGYLPDDSFFVPSVVDGDEVILGATSVNDSSSGDGILATLTFEFIAIKESTITLSHLRIVDDVGEPLPYFIKNHIVPVGVPRLREDVNFDGVVDILDLTLVATSFGQGAEKCVSDVYGDVNKNGVVDIEDLILMFALHLDEEETYIENTIENAFEFDPDSCNRVIKDPADVNEDGIIDIVDLVLVAGALGNVAAAPSVYPQAVTMLSASDVQQWLEQAQQLNLTDATSQRGILFLRQLLTILLAPKKTALLSNYPNPFNPETWIPYHLAKPADVKLHIYKVNGTLVRTLALGHKAAGMYQNRSCAAYWDGKNEQGESVASGVYFYTLKAGDFTATRKMLIKK